MVKIGQSIVPVDFHSSTHPLLPVEVIDSDELFGRVASAHFELPQRPSFDCLMRMDAGHGTHTVDFVDVPARPGRFVRIRAGQSQSWEQRPGFEATLVLSAPGTSTPQPWFPGDPSFTDLDGETLATADALIAALERVQRSFEGDDASIRLMIALFDALAALFDHSAESGQPAGASPIYVAFRAAVESDVSRRRDVAHYAQLISYSERTITRACLRATGQTAKQVLISRLVLEAKRLLTQTDDSIAAISQSVGFTEPTNFTKFFVRHAGTTPSRHRSATTTSRHTVGQRSGSGRGGA